VLIEVKESGSEYRGGDEADMVRSGRGALKIVSHSKGVCAMVSTGAWKVEAVGRPAPKFDTATTCLTSPSRRVTRSLSAAFSVLSCSMGDMVEMTGLTSSTGIAGTSAGGGWTAERLIPPVGGTSEAGIPKSAASEKTA